MTRVTYEHAAPVATITMDDGKANALSLDMIGELHAAFDRAAADGAGAVVLVGRDGVFCGGFDLTTMRGGSAADIAGLVRAGFELSERLLTWPAPIVVGCTGHTVAMGVFLALSGDYRVGASGDVRIVANEVAIGLTMPLAAIEILRLRLTPAALDRAVNLAETFSPADAVAAGLLDRVVDPAEVVGTAREQAAALATGLDPAAHAASKLRARGPGLAAIRAGIVADFDAFTGGAR